MEILRYDTRYVSLKPQKGCQKHVLCSYIIEPFLRKNSEPLPNSHTNYWESWQIVNTFLQLGYAVDVIDYTNKFFTPKKDYSIFIGSRRNFQSIAQQLNEDCLKIAHLTTAHWLFNSAAEYARCLDLKERRGMSLSSLRPVEENWAIEYADCATMLGNNFTKSTYTYAQKPIYSLSIPACTVYPWADDKNFEKCRNHFLWFGNNGFVHKGLDLVLDVFSEMPDYELTICGPIQKEKAFEKAFYKELYETPNIHTVGWVDVTSPEFIDITNKCIGLIYPSASEGQSGAVVTCLQSGLIPIISYESGVDVNDFGIILKDCTIDEIKRSIQSVSKSPTTELEKMAKKAWKFARANYTREKYSDEFRKTIEKIITDYKVQK